jgi:hypothetical protein
VVSGSGDGTVKVWVAGIREGLPYPAIWPPEGVSQTKKPPASKSLPESKGTNPESQRPRDAKKALASLGVMWSGELDPESGQKIQPILRMPATVMDAELKGLPEIPFRFFLDLSVTKVTDEGLKGLRSFKNLQGLRTSPHITDAGLKELRDFTEITWLDLSWSRVTGSGLKELGGLKKLTSLNLGATRVMDPGLKELRDFEQLTILSLLGTRVSDIGLRELKPLKRLTYLNLRETQVTDAGMKELVGLKQLALVDVEKTEVTAEGKKVLEKALPSCKVKIRRLPQLPEALK